jgi:hypothetical protein
MQGQHEEPNPHDLPEATAMLLAKRLGASLCSGITRRNSIHVECGGDHSQLGEGYKGYGYICKLKKYKYQVTELEKCLNFDATLNGR